jgi:hypothetical protein
MREFIIIAAERGWFVRSGEGRVQSFGDRNTAICAAVLAAHASQHQEATTQVIIVTHSNEAYRLWTSGFDGLSCDEDLARLALELVSPGSEQFGATRGHAQQGRVIL